MMVQYLLPPGIRGIVVAGLLSALMGSLAGVFNACSTLFTVDLYQKWKPQATQHQLVRTGRIATIVMVLIAMAWIPVIKNAQGLYNYLQSVQGYLAPPIFVVFFLGVFLKRMNAQGALWAMIVGFALGLFRMMVDTPVTLGVEKGYRRGFVPVDRQQHLFPVLQRADYHRLRGGDGGSELGNQGAGLRTNREPDFCDADGGGSQEHADELDANRRAGVGGSAGLYYGSLFVFPGITAQPVPRFPDGGNQT